MDIEGTGTGAVTDFDSATRRLSAWKGRIDRLAADTKTMSDRLGELQVRASDANRVVEVVLDASGALVDLRLSPRAERVGSQALAQLIMNTVREARQRLADRSQEIIAETLGTDSTAARAVAEQVGKRLRPPEPVGDQDRR